MNEYKLSTNISDDCETVVIKITKTRNGLSMPQYLQGVKNETICLDTIILDNETYTNGSYSESEFYEDLDEIAIIRTRRMFYIECAFVHEVTSSHVTQQYRNWCIANNRFDSIIWKKTIWRKCASTRVQIREMIQQPHIKIQ